MVPSDQKLAVVAEVIRHSPAPAVFDSAGKYGAGLAWENIGKALRQLGVASKDVIISNRLGWYRVRLRGAEPTFKRGVWAGIGHDAEARISYEGILRCHEQGCELLGKKYQPEVVSVHDPDEFLAAAKSPEDRKLRFADVIGAYKALFELKKKGVVKGRPPILLKGAISMGSPTHPKRPSLARTSAHAIERRQDAFCHFAGGAREWKSQHQVTCIQIGTLAGQSRKRAIGRWGQIDVDS